MSKKINVSIIGATGYTGLELLKILLNHPHVEIKYLISSSHDKQKISEVYPHLQHICEKELSNPNIEQVAKESDVIFLAMPHFEAQKIVPKIIGLCKIIDLSGDFRIKDSNTFQKNYGQEHECPEIISQFDYCLPEINTVKSSNISNPGCFATACQLALFPIKNFIKKANVVAITGSSGSGKTPSETTHHPIRNHNLKSYKIGSHQHMPEILQNLELENTKINLVPTSGPFTRGIHLTAFIELTENLDAKNLYEKAYAEKYFIRLKNNVELSHIIGSNFCDISIIQNGQELIVQAVIDNLLKGAAGTAVQNFNLINNLDEKTGLIHLIPLYP